MKSEFRKITTNINICINTGKSKRCLERLEHGHFQSFTKLKKNTQNSSYYAIHQKLTKKFARVLGSKDDFTFCQKSKD